jgi:hypothetical protein
VLAQRVLDVRDLNVATACKLVERHLRILSRRNGQAGGVG